MSGQKTYSKGYQEYINTFSKAKPKELDEILDNRMVALSLEYAREYQKNAKNFVNSFLKFQSIRSCCSEIVKAYKHTGAFDECKELGKDFTDYANKQQLANKWKPVLADILLIIYSIVKA